MQVTATDADDSSYGNSAKLVYSILQGQPYFSVEPDSGGCAEHMELDGATADACPWGLRRDDNRATAPICHVIHPKPEFDSQGTT